MIDTVYSKTETNIQKNTMAYNWMIDSIIPIIIDTADLDSLERQFTEYSNATYVNRKRSDAKSIEIFGYTNTERYNYLKKKILDPIANYDKGDVVNHNTINTTVTNTDIHNMGIETHTDTDPNAIHESANSRAREWSVGANIPIIYNTRSLSNLEKQYQAFMSTDHDNKRRSNGESIAIYGLDNIERYNKLKAMIMNKEDMVGDDYDDEFDEIESDSPISELCYRFNESVYDIDKSNILMKLAYLEQVSDSYVDKVYINNFIKENLTNVSDRKIGKITGMPFFTPSEMIDLGVYSDNNRYSNTPDNMYIDDGITTKQWFDVYQDICNGTISENNFSVSWINKVRDLYRDYDQIKESGDIVKINNRKQSILELGWNPEIEFSQENMQLADNRIYSLLEFKSNNGIKHVDLTKIDDASEPDMNAEERKDISPIYVILSRGHKLHSNIISKFTNSEYTHASIGTDHTMNNNYSFIGDGFNKENLNSYGKDRITVYSFFVNNKYMEKFNSKLEEFKQHAKDSVYDISKYFDYITNTTKEKANEYAQVCSTFVSKILSYAEVPIENIKRGIATPEDIRQNMNRNGIYKLYDGPANNYNATKVGKKIKKLKSSKSFKVLKETSFVLEETNLVLDYINESNSIDEMHYIWEHRDILNDNYRAIVESYIAPYTQVAVMELSDLPVQFNNDGDLLIYKVKSSKIDYHKELQDSIRLMKMYESKNDYDGMKYELAKLWYMNTSIEKALEKDSHNKKNVDARSNILNAFYTYGDKVLEHDKSWNFVEFYNSTPYSKEGIKVNRATLINTSKLLKGILNIK